jgi:hypothetical protein
LPDVRNAPIATEYCMAENFAMGQQLSFDHLVGRGEHHPRHGDAERFRRLEVYDEEIVRINVAELI